MSQEKTTTQRQRDAIVVRLENYVADRKREKLGCHQTAGSLGMEYHTLRRRLKFPETFTLGELQQVAEGLGVPLAELFERRDADGSESAE